MNSKTALKILGTRRSETSALAGVLNLMGASCGKELLQPQFDNPKGFFENKEITLFNERVLLPVLNSTWWNLKPISVEQLKQLINSEELINKAKDIIVNNFQYDKIIAIKDPRMCILFPFWEKILKDLFDIKVIISLRNPYEVAMSLKHRDGFTVEHSLLLWCKYLLYAEFYSRKYQRIFVYFDELLSNPKKVIDNIITTLKIEFPHKYENISRQIDNFLEKKLKHYNCNLNNTSVFELPLIKDTIGLFFPKVEQFNYENLNQLKKQYDTLVQFMHKTIYK